MKFRTGFALLHTGELAGIDQRLLARTHLKSARGSSARHHSSRETYSVLFLFRGDELAQLGFLFFFFWSLVLTGKAWKPINPRKLSIKGFNHFGVRTTTMNHSIPPFDGVDTVYLRGQDRFWSLVGLQTRLGHDVWLGHSCSNGFRFTPAAGWKKFL